MSKNIPALSLAAIDLGAGSGRVMLAQFDGRAIHLTEAHRFPNEPVTAGGTLHWDILRLFGDIKHGLGAAAKLAGGSLAGVGVDTWGVDFALLDASDALIGNPVHYRDVRTNNIAEKVYAIAPWSEIFERTGIQFLQFNSVFQLAALRFANAPALDHARTLLMIPDLINFWLCGVKANEYTNATTTQLIDARTRTWAHDLIAKLGFPAGLFRDANLAEPCRVLGEVRDDVKHAIGVKTLPLIVPSTHDTGSAVTGAPIKDNASLYLSSGTWSLMGFESPHPIINAKALAHNATNEGGVGNTARVLKNIMGLWLLQECRRIWAERGRAYDFAQLEAMARDARTDARIAADDGRFLAPDDMPARIREYCIETGQMPPETDGEIARCVLESLAITYAEVADKMDDLAGHRHNTIHVIGGGSQNKLLNELTERATGRTVLAGPVEATARGNVIAQLVALGELGSVREGRLLA
jgi:rhamnulokinase